MSSLGMHAVRLCWSLPLALGMVATATAAAPEIILRIGDPAPAIGTAGYTIESFVEPPSIVGAAGTDYSFVVFHVTIAGPNVTPNNSHVIYHWWRLGGITRVARGGDTIVFADGTRMLTILESPIASPYGSVAFTAQMSDGQRGLVLWRPSAPPLGVARVGQSVVVTCDALNGGPCGPVAGILGTLPTFADRKGMVFTSDSSAGSIHHTFAFRGVIQNTGGFGTPDALWHRDLVDDGISGTLDNLANSLQKANGLGFNNVYFDDFTDLAFCFGGSLVGLATVSRDAPYVVYEFTQPRNHIPLGRTYAPDLVPRRDLRCIGATAGYAGGLSSAPLDGVVANKGAWQVNTFTATQSQVYSNTVTPAPAPAGAILGTPDGHALALAPEGDLAVESHFAVNLLGSPANGRSGVYRGKPGGPVFPVIYETETLTGGTDVVDQIWSVAVSAFGYSIAHVRLADQRQLIRLVSPGYGDSEDVLATGDPITVAPGDVRAVTSFWMLGGTFGANPVLTGDSIDGIQSAFDENFNAVLVVYYGASGSAPAGAAIVSVPIEPTLFADGFED